MPTSNPSPVLYIPHGGGPLPILGDPQHRELSLFLQSIVEQLPKPASILVISAHWEEAKPGITGAAHPELIYDYFGFPEPAYHIRYDAAGNPSLARTIANLLKDDGIDARIDSERGFDHGLFVPLKLMYPDADIPCLQVSLIQGLDPAAHIKLGQSLAALRLQNVLIVGSGMSFHNLRAFFRPGIVEPVQSEAFDQWLVETCCSVNLPTEQRTQRLIDWEQAPFAQLCHPRQEHLIPLLVCYGAARKLSSRADVVFNQKLMGHKVSGFIWR